MKIKHYRAPDMRQALRQVRDAQGPDAVILSSRRISGGVEVVAAVDYDVDVDGAVDGAGSVDSDVAVDASVDGNEPSRTESRIPTAADYAALAQRFQGDGER